MLCISCEDRGMDKCNSRCRRTTKRAAERQANAPRLSNFPDLEYELYNLQNVTGTLRICKGVENLSHYNPNSSWQPKSKHLLKVVIAGSKTHLSNREMMPAGFRAPAPPVPEEYRSKVDAKGKLPKVKKA